MTILVLGLLVLVVIIIILRKKRHSSQEELKQFQDRKYVSGDVNVSTKEAMTKPAIAHSSSKPSKVSTLPVTLATSMIDNPNYESADTLLHYTNEVDSALLYAQPNFHTNTVSTHNSNAMYSEPLQPSDFTHVITQPPEHMEEENVPMYSSVYTLAATGNDTFHQTVEITSENITELKELGTGNFGQVILAKTNNLSLKDMRMSNRNENKNISVFVPVKKLRSNATSTQREAFEKEIKFSHPNV